ncbi:MAG: tRNA epoxyqueuosine(34) reductase QueG [Prolixibacteraceae bacterium]|nr:tRNA epoxyqueuosine(34) reductase QueG [Prolixibacteraceae bacterium]
MKQPDKISELIKKEAKSLGFSECVILPAMFLEEEKNHLNNWLKKGLYGEMTFMARNNDKRLDPRLFFENVKSLILVTQNYFTKDFQKMPDAPVVSKYTFGTDYHFVIKKKLKKLLSYIQNEIHLCKGRSFTDSAPILERAWARRAGLGWVGKNSNLISTHYGSFFFIGELLVDVELPYDKTEQIEDHCGSCTRCIDACPTKAIIADRVVDARKCISYQTIERKNGPEETYRGKLANRLFGCDICQDVCPWNPMNEPHNEPDFNPDPRLLMMTRKEWLNLSEAQFNELFKRSAVQRRGYDGIKKNLEFL